MSDRNEAMASHPAGKGKMDYEEPVDESQDPEPYLLDATNRCDSCGSQAYFRVYLEGGELDFCNHHFTKFAPRLNAITILDESERLHSNA